MLSTTADSTPKPSGRINESIFNTGFCRCSYFCFANYDFFQKFAGQKKGSVMRKVIGIGETILDIIFKDNKPVAAVPGGSTYNAMVSLGRSGVSAAFISETGHDRVGDYIIDFLRTNGVNADSVSVFPESKSPVSLAFLNENNDAEYIFYKDHPHDRLDFSVPDIHADDIVVFGSYYAVNPVIRAQVKGLLDMARDRGAIIYYDVNFRPSHKNEIMRVTPNLIENLELSDIVRGSDGDFETLYGRRDADKVYKSDISFYCKNFICTRGAEPVVLFGRGGVRREYPVEPAGTVSTIGAGDNFNAGLVYGLIRYGITRDMIVSGLSAEQWDGVVAHALAFASECCRDIYNYVSVEFGEKMKKQ